MRCPKCGYISFDHLEQCLKCKKNIKAVSDTLHGTVFHVEVPHFLKLDKRQEEEPDREEAFTDTFESDEDFVDDDLEVLVREESTAEIEMATVDDDLEIEVQGSVEKTLVEEDVALEDREIEIDLSQFEDSDEPEVASKEPRKSQNETESLALDLPSELADLSDLAPPSGLGVPTEKTELKTATAKASTDLNIGELDLDLGLAGLDLDLADGASPAKETILALDDIDFSETLTKSSGKTPEKQGGAGMDDDLNFDLDLGELTISKDR